jgi:hypothetical protein
MKSILDPSFRYTTSSNTDLHKTLARIRRHHRQEAEKAVRATTGPLAKVSSIVRKDADRPVKAFVSASLSIDNH